MLQFEARYNQACPPCENLHIICNYAKYAIYQIIMANITISHMTPRHFFETVSLLKLNHHRIYLTVDSIEVRFDYDKNESKEETDKRFERLEHFMKFLQELVDSEVPVDLEEFVRKYKKSPGYGYFRKR